MDGWLTTRTQHNGRPARLYYPLLGWISRDTYWEKENSPLRLASRRA